VTALPEFRKFPSIPRLYRDCTISEKLDGTNGAVVITRYSFGEFTEGVPGNAKYIMGTDDPLNSGIPDSEFLVMAQSRTRFITPDDDNHGFARWVWDNAGSLVTALGEGVHNGEWWGSGINRGYGLKKGEKRFSLFNTHKWSREAFEIDHQTERIPAELDVVPVLYQGLSTTEKVDEVKEDLKSHGSYAVPFMNPEGVVIYHHAAGCYFKSCNDNDDLPKSLVKEA
jgi:hypothetical protein